MAPLGVPSGEYGSITESNTKAAAFAAFFLARIEQIIYSVGMKSIRLAIFPGLIGGILCLLMMANFFTQSENRHPIQGEVQLNRLCINNQKISESVKRWCDLIVVYAESNKIDPLLIAAIIDVESGGDEQAISRDGAVGLMQVMPGDGKALEFRCPTGACFSGRPSTESLLEPEYNIAYGTELFAALFQQTSNLREALKNYGAIGIGYKYADDVMDTYRSYQ